MRVHNAVMKSDDEGFALDRIWLTDLRGRKVKLVALGAYTSVDSRFHAIVQLAQCSDMSGAR